jgi:hypothetical protein
LRSAVCCAVVVALALVAPGAAAVAASAVAPPAPAELPPVHLEVAADPTCATRGDLVARVSARSSRIRFGAEPGSGLALRALVSRGSGSVSATLEVSGREGAPPARQLKAATCDDALDALAVMIVVLLDPAAVLGGPPPAAGGGASPAPNATPRVVALSSPEAEPLPPRPWGAALGASAHAISGPAPRVMPGLAIDVVVARARGTGAPLWSPAVRLRWAHDWLPDWDAPGGRAAFTLDSLELDLCPLAVGTARISAWACAMTQAGRLAAQGSETFLAESHVRFLVAPGVAALATLRLWQRVDVEASLAAGPSLVRDSFAFRPEVFYRVAAVSISGSAGLRLTFQ